MNDNYYTAAEATRILGVSLSRFYSLVQQGKIAKIALPDDARRFGYRKEDIDHLAAALSQAQAEPTATLEQLVLKAYEYAEMASSRAAGMMLYLNQAREALPAHSPESEMLQALMERAMQVSQILQAVQLDISQLNNKLKES
jgi:hypothetical protein